MSTNSSITTDEPVGISDNSASVHFTQNDIYEQSLLHVRQKLRTGMNLEFKSARRSCRTRQPTKKIMLNKVPSDNNADSLLGAEGNDSKTSLGMSGDLPRTDITHHAHIKIESSKVEETELDSSDLMDSAFPAFELEGYHKKIKCADPECKNLFDSISNMGKHMQESHPVPKNPPKKTSRTKLPLKSRVNKAKNECKINKGFFVCDADGCGKIFTEKKNLTSHKVSHQVSRPFLCMFCSKGFKTKSTLKVHESSHYSGRNFPCDYPNCGKTFKTRSNLKSHHCSHSTEPTFVCPFEGCGKSYKNPTSLSDHSQLHKISDNETFTCSCGKTFLTKRRLYRHKKRFHEKSEETYMCTFEGCNKAYKTKDYLNYHLKSHNTGEEKTIMCDHPGCEKMFRDSNGLTRHKRKVHPDSRVFMCNICAKSFKTRDTLKAHEFAHYDLKPFVCSEPNCGKSFRTKSNCKAHQFTHSGEKQFRCQYCELAFRSAISKLRHEEHEHSGNELEEDHFEKLRRIKFEIVSS